MGELARETEHVTLAIARVVEQFKPAERLQALLSALVGPIQEIDDAVWQLYTERWPAVAEGVNLDMLGEIVGQPREGRDDETYRLWIAARVYVNRSTGKGDDTVHVMALIAPDAEVTVTETFPAAYMVEAVGLTPDPVSIWQILLKVKPAGVQMNFAYSDADPDFLFTFAPSSTLVAGDTDKGFGDSTNPATGGQLIGLL